MTAIEAAFLLAAFAVAGFVTGLAVEKLSQRCISNLWPEDSPAQQRSQHTAEPEDYDWITSDHAALGTTATDHPPHHLEP